MKTLLQSVRSRVTKFVKSSPRILDATAGLMRTETIETRPGWLGRLHEIAVPRMVVANPQVSPRGPANINIIFDLLRATKNVEGEVAECGVYRGRTIVSIALWLQQHGDRRRIYGFDSFSGFPDNGVAHEIALGGASFSEKRVGGFSDTSLDMLRRKLRRFRVDEMVTLEPGFFAESLMRRADLRFSFVHLDCDLYESYRECLNFFYPRLTPGAVVLFDEYNDPPWPGCNRAVDEFLEGKPEKLQRAESDNHEKWYFTKL